MKKVALITGITGQDGSYLAEFLLQKGYVVHGVKRRTSLINTARIDSIYQDDIESINQDFHIHYGDSTDGLSMLKLIKAIEPCEIYNLAAMSHVKVSFDHPDYVSNVDGLGALRILESIKILELINKTKFYQASTSELYGKVQEIPQNELTPFYPRSPYAVSKLYAYWITKNYREAYGMFACNGILFNHESPRRGETFVTRKITLGIAQLIKGEKQAIYLGNIDAKRDWGHAKDYVESMWMMLQADQPDDYVIATGKTTAIRDFIIMAFRVIGVEVIFKGQGIEEIGVISKTNKKYEKLLPEGKIVIKIDPRYFRPTEVDILIGDSSKAKKVLGWSPKINLEELVKEMVLNDVGKDLLI